MKSFLIISLFISIQFLIEIKAQTPPDTITDVFTNLEELLPGDLPYFDGPTRGGRHKTANGILKTLVVFVRFADDNTLSSSWPNPDYLPD
jgi:hypothetical protein